MPRSRFLLASLALAALGLTACSGRTQQQSGSARVIAAAGALSGVTGIDITVLDASGNTVSSQPLTRNGSDWEGTITGIPVGTYTFNAITSGSLAGLTGSASGIDIVEGQTALVTIVLHQLAPPPVIVAPAIEAIVASNAALLVGETITLTGVATGTPPLTYDWTASDGGFGNESQAASGATVSWTAPATQGEVDFTLTVSDTLGNQAALSFAIVVSPRTGAAQVTVLVPPQITSLTAQQFSSGPAAWQLDLQVTTPGEEALVFAWTVDEGCPVESSFDDPTSQFPAFYISGPGTCVLTATVTAPIDGLEVSPWASASIRVTDANPIIETPPRITDSSQSAASAAGGERVTFSVTAIDEVDAPEQLSYAWTATQGTASGAGMTFGWTAPPCFQGDAIVTAKVTNSLQLSATQSFTVAPGAGAACPAGTFQWAGAFADGTPFVLSYSYDASRARAQNTGAGIVYDQMWGSASLTINGQPVPTTFLANQSSVYMQNDIQGEDRYQAILQFSPTNTSEAAFTTIYIYCTGPSILLADASLLTSPAQFAGFTSLEAIFQNNGSNTARVPVTPR
ncbi:MAG: hypothetical protein JST92_23915 [Deltaproteobacteria bacterium]|nr:hypothetical protein [Deltaproteobacteria bacterium]